MNQFDVKIPVKARDEKEAASVQQALYSPSAVSLPPSSSSVIAKRLENPIIKAAVIQKLS
jgi:hypothetical protein